MAFVAAMNAPTKIGVNGETVYTEHGVGDPRVALFTMLTRNLGRSYIGDMVAKIVTEKGVEGLEDLALMTFHTRDIRGGKGERDIFRHLFVEIAKQDLQLAVKLIPLVPEYGCWKDLWKIWWELYACPMRDELCDEIVKYVTKVYREDLELTEAASADSINVAEKKGSPSLLAKWLPREKSLKSTHVKLAHTFADSFFPDAPRRARMVLYRKDVSKINKYLKTVEINMCGGDWAHIVPAHVPGRNLKLHTKAFLNQKLKGSELRKPDDNDRMECREHFLAFLNKVKTGEAKAKGANVVFPHEIVTALQSLRKPADVDQIDMLEAQWASIREATAALGGMGRMVPMCDFSGSMEGTPMMVSYALGVLISEVNHSAFRDHILTFDSTPAWHSFKDCKSLYDKVRRRGTMGQGLSTDFFKAAMLILDKMVEAKVPVGEEPEDLVVLTDMGWDAASRPHASHYGQKVEARDPWKSQIQTIRDRFAEESKKLWGEAAEGWKVPRIIVWNLRAEYKDFQAKADDEGVVVISGWSPAVLKALQKDGVKSMTPYQGMRNALDDKRYDPVREVLKEHVAEKAKRAAAGFGWFGREPGELRKE
jgi:hypothetical protein